MCSIEKKLHYGELDGTASANETECKSVARIPPEGHVDVPEPIHPGNVQPEIEQAAMSVTPIKSVGENQECNDEEEEEVDGAEEYQMFINNAATHVCLEYMRLMVGDKRDESERNYSSVEEI